jgi:hypothetical protein
MSNENQERAIRAESKADVALEKIDDHERVCAERYKGIYDDLKLLSQRMWHLLIVALLGVIGVFVDLLIRHLIK